jgi:peptide/nickel transport system substrate-binding protein
MDDPPARRLNRRAFLGGMTASAAALLAACGGDGPLPTAPTAAATTAAPGGASASPTAGRPPTASPGAAATSPTAAAARPIGGGLVRVANPFFPAGLDPAVGTQGSTIAAMGLGECLTRITAQGEVAPWLAEGIEVVDATRWRVRLREGVTFHNGKPVDATAVQKSLGRTLEKNAAPASLLQLARVEAPDPRTVILETKGQNGGVPAILTSAQLIIHDADEAARVGDAAFGQKSVTTSPFMATAFTPGQSASVVRYEKYWQGVPAIERAEFRAVADGNARLAGVLAGDVDLARNLAPQGIAQLKGAGFTVQTVTTIGMYHIFLNNKRPPLDDLAVRRALNLAVDRKTLIDRVLNGGDHARGVYPSFLPFAGEGPLPFGPTRARQLLDEAGWRAGGDGIRAKDGKRLEFETLTYPQRPELGLLATAIQATLKDVGMAMAIRTVEDITKPVTTADYTTAMYSLQTAPTGDPSYIMNILYKSTGAWNGQIGYQSARLDAAADRLTAELDSAKRAALALEAQQILAEDVPVIYLMFPLYHIGHTAKLRGFEAHPLETYLLDHRWKLG